MPRVQAYAEVELDDFEDSDILAAADGIRRIRGDAPGRALEFVQDLAAAIVAGAREDALRLLRELADGDRNMLEAIEVGRRRMA
jgi:hypothetical protein